MIALANELPDEPDPRQPSGDAATPAPSPAADPMCDEAAEMAMIGHLLQGNVGLIRRATTHLGRPDFVSPAARAAFEGLGRYCEEPSEYRLVDFLDAWSSAGHAVAFPNFLGRCYEAAAMITTVDAARAMMRERARRESQAVAIALSSAALDGATLPTSLIDLHSHLGTIARRWLSGLAGFRND